MPPHCARAMAARPRRRRFKLRTRSYLDTGSSYLEIKTRGARGTTVKERDEYDTARRAELTSAARGDVAAAFDGAGHLLCVVGGTVRDALLGRSSPDADWDLATDARPEQILAIIGPLASATWTTAGGSPYGCYPTRWTCCSTRGRRSCAPSTTSDTP